MKKYCLGLLLALLCLAMEPIKKTHILFLGDSITQLGVNKGGYIDQIRRFIDSTGNSAAYQLTGAGISGNKVYDLYLRLDSDVLDKKPDLVVVWVGVNDVWHKATHGTGTDIDKFEKFYSALVSKMQAQNIQVILCTPSTIGEKYDNSNQQDGDLNAYSNVIRKLARRMTCGLIDLRKTFLEYELANNTENKESGILTSDRVHLNEKGNALVAAEMIKALDIR